MPAPVAEQQLPTELGDPLQFFPETIPEWHGSVPEREELAEQSDLNETTATVLGEGSVLPVVLGESVCGGKVIAADYNEDTATWTVGFAWCVGECEAIVQVYMNGAAPVSGVTQEHHLGTDSQTASTLLSAVFTGYSDDLVVSRPGGDIGVCYSVLQWNDEHYDSFPDVQAVVQGLLTDSGSYSASPARGIEFLCESDILGPGLNVDATSIGTLVTDNAALVSGEARRLIGVTIDRPLPFDQWLKILSAYASCWVTKRGDTYTFASDRPRSQDAALTTDNWEQGSFSVQQPSTLQVPTVVEVVYTDTTTTPWRERTAREAISGVDVGTVPERISRVKMPGVTRYSQAKREALERLNKLQNGQTISFVTTDEATAYEMGDVIDITYGSLYTNQDFRIVSPPVKQFGGGVRVQASLYDASVYSDQKPVTPTWQDPPRVGGTGTRGLSNIIPMGYGSFENLTLDDFKTNDQYYSVTVSLDTVVAKVGSQSLKVVHGTGPESFQTNSITFAKTKGAQGTLTELTPNLDLIAGRRYILWAWFLANNAAARDDMTMSWSLINGGVPVPESVSFDFNDLTVGVWKQVSCEISASGNGGRKFNLAFNYRNPGTGAPSYNIDALMLSDVTQYPYVTADFS